MPISSSYPTIAPTLNLDFANAQSLDPRITFQRGTIGTYYDADTLALAEQNLLVNSTNPSNTSWVMTNGYAGTLGTELVTNGDFASGGTSWTAAAHWTFVNNRAEKVSIADGELQQTISATTGKNYVVLWNQQSVGSFYLRFGGSAGNTYFKSGTGSAFWVGPLLGTPLFRIEQSGTIAGDWLDNISVKEVSSDNVLAPDGTSTAVTAIASAANATFTQSVTANYAVDYTFSVWLRRKTGTGNVNISCGDGTWATRSITGSWARYSVTQTVTYTGTCTPGIRIVTSGDEVEIWGAQFEQKSGAGVYVPTTTDPITNYIPVLRTAPVNEPRFDFNPVTRQSLGLLMEQQSTNLLTYSGAMDITLSARMHPPKRSSLSIAPITPSR
jgi:hypothetical protein